MFTADKNELIGMVVSKAYGPMYNTSVRILKKYP